MSQIKVEEFFDFLQTHYPRWYKMSFNRTGSYSGAVQWLAYHTRFNRKLMNFSSESIYTRNYLWNLKQHMLQPQCVEYLRWIEDNNRLIVKSSSGKYKQC